MFNKKRVLVTGGTGIVGRELVKLLAEEGAYVTSISLDDNNFNPHWNVDYIKADLRNFNTCRNVVHGKDYVFHVAGIKGSPILVKQKPYVFFTNFIQMNTNMIAAMYDSPDMKWGLYTSTVGTYGPAEIFHESKLWDQMPSPNDWYAGWAKRMGELQIDAYKDQTGDRRISIIKPVNIYGSFDNHDLRSSTLVPSLIRKVYEATDTVDIWGTGESQRDIIHAKDVARAAKLVVEQKYDLPINIGNGRGVPIKSLVETIIKVSGKDLKITHDLTKPTGDQNRIADINRLKNLGFKSIVSLEDGLRETYNWYHESVDGNGIYSPLFKRYDPFFTDDYTNRV